MNACTPENSILTQRIEAATEVLNGRKKKLSGKRKSLNGKRIMTVAELELLRWAEEVTRRRKRKRTDEASTTEYGRNRIRTSMTC